MAAEYKFSVPFVPTKRRARFYHGGRRPYIDAKTVSEMNGIKEAYEGPHLTGKVFLRIDAYRTLPKSTPKRVESLPYTIKSDVDNIAKAVMDALNGLAFDDDKQVTRLEIVKHDRTRDSKEETLITVKEDADDE